MYNASVAMGEHRDFASKIIAESPTLIYGATHVNIWYYVRFGNKGIVSPRDCLTIKCGIRPKIRLEIGKIEGYTLPFVFDERSIAYRF